MESSMINVLFALLRESVCGQPCPDALREQITPEMLPKLYAISKSHDISHLLAGGLHSPSLAADDPFLQKFAKQQMLAVYRYRQINYELEQVCLILEAAAIPFIPLKGSVLRRFYPQPWMRTSCDIDILVHESDLDRAIEVLVAQRGYENKGRDYHDVSLFSSGGVHLELHFDLVEEEYANEASRLLERVWEYATPREDCSYHCEMREEMFYFYHMAHMAKHFEFGGCGIRPLLDLWILDHSVEHDALQRDRLLEEGALLVFANACRSLSGAWFSGATADATAQAMQRYILTGGVYGSMENRVAVQQKKSGGRLGYLLSRIFLPYESLRDLYPILQKKRWLMPLMQVRRWFRLLFGGRMKQSLRELRTNEKISEEKRNETASLLDRLDLH